MIDNEEEMEVSASPSDEISSASAYFERGFPAIKAADKKLYLDDLRKPPEGYELARNFKDCIFMLSKDEYYLVSLDYALGEKWTGLDVLKWMAEHQKFPKQINIHSTYHFGRSAMIQYIKGNFPEGYIFTVNSGI